MALEAGTAAAGMGYTTASGSHCCWEVVPFAAIVDTIEADKNDSRFARGRIADSDEECNSAIPAVVHRVME